MIVDPEGIILREVGDARMKRADVALTYAFALRQRDEVDFAKVNAAIIERWSLSALQWIKAEAWAWVEGRRG